MSETFKPTPDDLLPRASYVAPPEDAHDPEFPHFFAFVRTFFVPMLVTKAFILYFGLNYSMYPGEGYGYGLVISLCVTLFSFAFLIWSHRRSKSN